MKKQIYILLCALLGLLMSFILHVLIEVPIIMIMVRDFERYSLGLSWGQLMLVHWIFTAVLAASGAYLGFRAGQRWWRYIYVEKRYKGIFSRKNEK